MSILQYNCNRGYAIGSLKLEYNFGFLETGSKTVTIVNFNGLIYSMSPLDLNFYDLTILLNRTLSFTLCTSTYNTL